LPPGCSCFALARLVTVCIEAGCAFGLTGIATALYYSVAAADGRIYARGVSGILIHFILRMLDPSAVAGIEEEIYR
jgi:hypothetical protein